MELWQNGKVEFYHMTMKQYLTKLQPFFFLLLSILSPALKAELPNSFSATYALHYDGLRIGVMQREFLHNPDGTGTFTSNGKLTGLAALFKKDKISETSQWELVGDQLRPVEYSYEKSKEDDKKKEHHLFDWEKKLTTSTTSDGEIELALSEGMVDKLLYQLDVMNMEDIRHDLEYHIVDRHQIKTYKFEFLGEEDLKTPMGMLKTLKFQRSATDSKKSTTLWCAPSLHNLPVRVDVTSRKENFTSIIIEKETGLSSQ